MIKTIIFDYDGVLVDSFSNVYEVYKTICGELNAAIPDTIEKFRKVYGYDFHECYRNLGFHPEQQKRALEIFRREILLKEPKVFEGVREVLDWAGKRCQLALVSANFAEEVLAKLRKNGLDPYFSIVVGQEYGGGELDKSKEFAAILDRCHSRGEETIVIGDRESDYDAGKRAGIENVLLVEYGWGYDRNRIPDYHYKIENPMQLMDAIRERT